MLFRRIINTSLLVLISLSLALLFLAFLPNISIDNNNSFLYISKNDKLPDIEKSLSKVSKTSIDISFKLLAKLSRYDKNIKPGKYHLKNNMSNFDLIRLLYSGRQTPVKLTFNNIRTKEQLAAILSKQIMADSSSICKLLNDNVFLSKYDLNPKVSKAIFLPNTYEVFWNIEAKDIFLRMLKEYKRFWTDERRTKAANIPMTIIEVSTLASIVEEETNKKSEKNTIAGLYINRLKKGMLLQADPTVKFATGDFSLRRIRAEHLDTNSPYNTYKYVGLPPGPIRLASAESIDAVLNYEKHRYLFMCAKETLNGEHNFSRSFNEHLKNARKYQRALNKRKIFK